MMAGGDGCIGGVHGYGEDVASVGPVCETAHACGWEDRDIVILDRFNGDLIFEEDHGSMLVAGGQRICRLLYTRMIL